MRTPRPSPSLCLHTGSAKHKSGEGPETRLGPLSGFKMRGVAMAVGINEVSEEACHNEQCLQTQVEGRSSGLTNRVKGDKKPQ